MTQPIQPPTTTPLQPQPWQPPRPQIPQQYARPAFGQAPYSPPPLPQPQPPVAYPPPAYPPAPARARRRTGLTVGVIAGVVVIVAGVVVGGLLLFGKSSLDTAALQKDITQLTQEKAGVAATDVSCPTDRPLKAGDQFTCTAQLDGQPARFTVQQRDGKGNVHVQLDNTLVVVSRLEDLLTKQVSDDVGFQVTSSCQADGHTVLVDGVGKPVRCTVTDLSNQNNSIDVMATVDDQGQVSYKEA